MPSIAPTTDEHLQYLAPRLRESDRLEIQASSGEDPLVALRRGVAGSRDASAVMLVGGEPIAVAGCATLGLDLGSPWALGTEEIREHKVAFLRASRKTVEVFGRDFNMLANYVDARNALTIHWLGWLGFTLDAPQPHGVEGLPFHFFWKRRI
jgi:hypothetical protein|tara:strand:- start:213 stop:668 length:456 start_codon:yes stop_codon:yes gene_type:complete